MERSKKITDKQFISIVDVIAQSSYCKRSQVGAIIVKDLNIIALGYNGTPSGFDNECEDCDNNTRKHVLHAESNAIAKCARSTTSTDGSTLYCSLSPCFECAKMIIQAGIKRVVFKEYYRTINGIELLEDAGIEVLLCQ